MKSKDFKVVHHSVRKIDALTLARGGAVYAPDLVPANALHVKMLWSPHAHARIVSIDTSKAEAMPGVKLVLHHGNVPRVPHTTAGQGFPEPSPYDTFMFDRKVRFVGDRVAAVIAETRDQAVEAVQAIEVVYEELPAVLSIDEALREGSPVIHDEPEAHVPIPVPYEPEKNVVARVGMDVGSLEEGLAAADIALDDTYETHYAQHVPIEPHVSFASLAPDGRVIIVTSTQVPFHVRRIVAQTLEIPVQRIRVIKPRIGGGFGVKQEILLEDVVALGALRTGRPVYWKYSREEEFVSSRTRHPIRTRLRLGVKKDGSITALGMDCLSNTGAYGGHGLTVVCNSGSKMLPLYRAANIHFTGTAVYTNLPVGGAYRGYGATQSAFPVECMVDEIAEKIGMDPLEFRLLNHIKTGETSPVFRALGEGKAGVEQAIGSCKLAECVKLGAKEIGWKKRGSPAKKTGRYRRGIGMCCLMQGSSIPEIDMGAASLKMNEDGSFNLLMGATDLGTGSDTVLAQIAAEELGTTVDKIIVYSSDTDMTPFDVGAYASSTTYLSGSAVQNCAGKVKKQILTVASSMLGVPVKELTVSGARVLTREEGKSVSFSEVAIHSLYASDQHQIGAMSSHITHKSPPPFSAHFAEVEVDTLTGMVKVLRYVAAVDCGTAINPKLAEGQTEGGVLNGISFALTEEYLFSPKGKMLNASMQDYKIFSMRDKPEIKTILVPSYEKTGPFGAKSVSEICINGPIPAIANAIYNAVGVRLKASPFTPEKVWRAMQGG
ncbi:MAG TPA: molybdopterin-dependent oxidoreductase [Kiritimatiellia bacterium]|nr:molybdopterin-dependent oxidoreductase [Kiritimatiellia bacterium]